MHPNTKPIVKFLAIVGIPIASLCSECAYEGNITNFTTKDILDQTSPFNKIWEPHFAKWMDSHFICAYHLPMRGKVYMGDIVVSLSRDKGETLSPRIIVFDHRIRNGTVQYAYNNSVLFRPPNQGFVGVFAMPAPHHYRDSANADVIAAYTADGGYSWRHRELALGYQGSLIIVARIETVERGGATYYLLPIHLNSQRHDPFGDWRQFVLESKNLLNWNLASYIDYPAEKPVFLHEEKIAQTDDSSVLKIVMRTATMDREHAIDPPLAHSSISDDGGQT